MTINCDNHCHVYINGIYQIENYDWSQPSAINTTIDLDNDVIAVSLISWGGIIAFRSIIDVIDSKIQYNTNSEYWKCINDKPFDNWNINEYDDRHWPLATSYGNGNDIWGNVGYANTTSDWISSDDIASNHVLCRYKPLSTHNKQCLSTLNGNTTLPSLLGKPSLLVVIPGFGKPEIDIKMTILKSNVKKLKESTEFSSVKFHIFQYDTEFEMPVDIAMDPLITIKKEVGILGQFLYKHVTPDYVNDYDYILILLDDVEIVDVSWSELIMMKKLLKYDIASCCLKEGYMSYWDFTRHLIDNNVWIREQSICELFCYMMDTKTYEKYYQFIDNENPWMWGMDLILQSKMNLQCAVFNKFTASHYIRGGHTNADASTKMYDYLAKYNTSWSHEEKQIKMKRVITIP